jgi:hypothetical protein
MGLISTAAFEGCHFQEAAAGNDDDPLPPSIRLNVDQQRKKPDD